MKLDTRDMDTIIAYVLSDVRQNGGIKHIQHLAQLRALHMTRSIEIASQALARIQYDSLYGH